MIELTDVVKAYRTGWRAATVRALNGVSLRVEPGTALGVVGLNAAGKSTLLRLLLGYVRPSEGEARVGGLAPRAYTERHGVAYVPEQVAIPGHWTVREAMRAYAMLGDLGRDAWERVERALDRLGLQPLGGRRVATLSKGNRQRLAIAQALLGDRQVMVLDEPTDGLDPLWVAELRAILGEWRAGHPERLLVLASHDLSEVGQLTDQVLLLHNGRFQAELGGEKTADGATLEQRFLRAISELEAARA